MYSDKTLYRSRDALLGGVCAGIADYFAIDPILVRIAMVVVSLATTGFGVVFYLAMWVILPKQPQAPVPVDVDPESVHSETYGAVDCGSGVDAAVNVPVSPAAAKNVQAGVVEAAVPTPNYSVGMGHTPPVPPQSYATYTCVPPAATMVNQPSAPNQHSASVDTPEPSARVMLLIGLLLLFFGLAALLGNFIEGVSWWRFWPLLLVIVGIAFMVVPGKKKSRMRQFFGGLLFFSGGVVALLISLQLISFRSIGFALEGLWPLLLIMLGLLVLGSALKSPLLTFLAGGVFVAFCVGGIVWFAVPGSAEFITLQLPFSRFVFMNPWM
ncbi:MAG: PspC domain-containing protein [Raoultibacter sp.]